MELRAIWTTMGNIGWRAGECLRMLRDLMQQLVFKIVMFLSSFDDVVYINISDFYCYFSLLISTHATLCIFYILLSEIKLERYCNLYAAHSTYNTLQLCLNTKLSNRVDIRGLSIIAHNVSIQYTLWHK